MARSTSAPVAAPGSSASSVLAALLPQVEMIRPTPEQAALFEHLWTRWPCADAAEREAARTLLDGRYQPLLALIDASVDAGFGPAARAALVEALLDGRVPQPDAQFFSPHQLGLLAWALTGPDQPELAPTPALLAARLRAGLHARLHLPLHLRRCHDRQAAPWPDPDAPPLADLHALQQHQPDHTATAFALAVLDAADAPTAAALLAAAIHTGQAAQVPLRALQDWLEGTPDTPLALHERDWLHTADLTDPARRALIHAVLQRPQARERWALLRAALGDIAPEAHAEDLPEQFALLRRLDALYLRAAQGRPLQTEARTLLHHAGLAATCRSSLWRLLAVQQLDQGDLHAAWHALTQSRREDGSPESTLLLDRLLCHLRQIAAPEGAVLHHDWLGQGAEAEHRHWLALALGPDALLAALASLQIASLHTHGTLTPTHRHKLQNAALARAHWEHAAQNVPAWQEHATRALRNPVLQAGLHLRRCSGGREHLWVPALDAQAERLLIVFSCVDSHHSYTSTASLINALPDRHLLFVNNPELNWYDGEAFDAIGRLIERQVLPRFRPEQVCCYFGSMGGHGALRVATRFGFQAVVFNPQTDLAIWAAFRPFQRDLLLGCADTSAAGRIGSLQRTPLYYAVGSSTPDRLAFSELIQLMRHCRDGRFMIEKAVDARHAGLVARLWRDIPARLRQIDLALARLRGWRPHAAPRGQGHGQAELWQSVDPDQFWPELDQAASWSGSICIHHGRVRVQRHGADGPMLD